MSEREAPPGIVSRGGTGHCVCIYPPSSVRGNLVRRGSDAKPRFHHRLDGVLDVGKYSSADRRENGRAEQPCFLLTYLDRRIQNGAENPHEQLVAGSGAGDDKTIAQRAVAAGSIDETED